MYSNFPGLDSYLAEKKVLDVENSITSSLIINDDKPPNKFKLIYIVIFILIGLIAAAITYVFIKIL